MRALNLLQKYLITGVGLAVLIVAATAGGLHMVYRTSVDELVRNSVTTSRGIIAERVSERGLSLTRALADELVSSVTGNDFAAQEKLLRRARSLSGASLVVVANQSGKPVVQLGDLAAVEQIDDPTVIGTDLDGSRLRVAVPLRRDGITIGYLAQIFDAAAPLAAVDGLGAELRLLGDDVSRRSLRNTLWLVLTAILLVSAIVALLAYRQTRAIGALVGGADRLAAGDYRANLALGRGDELGQLASAFDRMREKLRRTTISRDYLDRVLNSMSDAIILVAPDGQITRLNESALLMLDFHEPDLIGKNIQELIAPDQRRRFSIAAALQSPEETVLVTRGGSELPVSLSSSRIDAEDPGFRGFIISARNITERKVAEQRIRYLARIDALTKVPNRMQFQHLLQRAIARARRGRRRRPGGLARTRRPEVGDQRFDDGRQQALGSPRHAEAERLSPVLAGCGLEPGPGQLTALAGVDPRGNGDARGAAPHHVVQGTDDQPVGVELRAQSADAFRQDLVGVTDSQESQHAARTTRIDDAAGAAADLATERRLERHGRPAVAGAILDQHRSRIGRGDGDRRRRGKRQQPREPDSPASNHSTNALTSFLTQRRVISDIGLPPVPSTRAPTVLPVSVCVAAQIVAPVSVSTRCTSSVTTGRVTFPLRSVSA